MTNFGLRIETCARLIKFPFDSLPLGKSCRHERQRVEPCHAALRSKTDDPKRHIPMGFVSPTVHPYIQTSQQQQWPISPVSSD